jgi:glycosyltransferase involved in cell wall biosynthesis
VADLHFGRTKSVGIFNLALGLLKALSGRPEIRLLHILSNRTLRPHLSGLGLPAVVECDTAIGGRLSRLWWDQAGVLRAGRRSGCGWLFLPKGFVPFRGSARLRMAAYVHDTLPCFYRERGYPRLGSRWERQYFTAALHATLRHARVIFTNSEFSRRELQRHAAAWQIQPPPVVVAGIGFAPRAASVAEKDGSLVCLASRFPHKLTPLAVDYLARWQRERDYTGAVHWIGRGPADLAWPAFSNWHQHLRLDDVEYQRRIASAQALLFFSEYEGFGMPPVEAALGETCPVYSRLPATEEVMGGQGLPFYNHSYESFKAALDQALQTSPDTVSAWAATLLARHNWPDVAGRVIRGLTETEPDR